MLYLHTYFDLSPDVSLEDYQKVLDAFSADMLDRNLIQSTGPIAERCLHPVMDTDEERGHQYFFTMTFTDREQCDAAVSHIKAGNTSSDPVHRAVYKDIICPIFTCWADPE